MFSSLKFRLWLTYILVVGAMLVIAVTAVGVYMLRNPIQDRRELQRLRMLSNIISQREVMEDFQGPGGDQIPLDSLRFEQAVRRADRIGNARIVVYDSSGALLADSRGKSAPPIPEWAFFASRELDARAVFRDATGRQWLYSVTHLENGLILLAAVPRPRLAVLEILRDDFLAPFLRAGLLALALTLLLSIWITNWISAPLRRLENAAQRVSNGEYEKIPVEGPDELKSVGQSFNEMIGSVQDSQQAQRDLVANISHDLKTPLTSIQGFAQAICDGTAESPDSVKHSARIILDESIRMHRLVLELLDLSRMEAGTLQFARQPVELEGLLRKEVERFAPQALQAGLNLSLDVAGGEPRMMVVSGDEERLGQVFSNLIDNALKNTPTGGEIIVTGEREEEWVEVRVIDSGQGIPENELKRIFERFYQTDKARSAGRGSGLGLAIAREIVQAHGGTLTASRRSQTGGTDGTADSQSSPAGSVFIARLPAARQVVETAAVKIDLIPPKIEDGE